MSILGEGNDVGTQLIAAGVAIGVLDRDDDNDEVLFVHQLMQEYFAARHLANEPNPGLVAQEWHVDRVPPIPEMSDSDPLPLLPQTEWEETTMLAAPMAAEPTRFIRDLMEHNLPLAGHCAAQPEIHLTQDFRKDLGWALVKEFGWCGRPPSEFLITGRRVSGNPSSVFFFLINTASSRPTGEMQ